MLNTIASYILGTVGILVAVTIGCVLISLGIKAIVMMWKKPENDTIWRW